MSDETSSSDDTGEKRIKLDSDSDDKRYTHICIVIKVQQCVIISYYVLTRITF